MSLFTRNLTPIERRMRELEREARRLKHDIRSASRSARKNSGREEPAPSRPAEHRLAATSSAWPSGPRSTINPFRERIPDERDDGLDQPVTEADATRPPEEPRTRGSRSGYGPDEHFRRDERFVSYLSTGGIQATRPLRQERAVQRNRAIVMVICVIMIAYIIFALFL